MQIIKGTPLYIWGVLAYLLFVGIKSVKTRVIYLPKLFIIPLVLLSMKYKTFLSEDVLVFCFAIIVGGTSGFFMHFKHKIKVIKKEVAVEVPGGYGTLIILLSFFIIKYYFGYLRSADPDLFLKYSIIESIISGLFSGYCIGRALMFSYKYSRDLKLAIESASTRI
ncbi:hypothetical protein Sarmat_00756 [Rickettsiales endosymbiont of Paramecium tredecaurelia]|nr:hypothetical protein [Candidatus Sarmatiella mevalonica]